MSNVFINAEASLLLYLEPLFNDHVEIISELEKMMLVPQLHDLAVNDGIFVLERIQLFVGQVIIVEA